MNCESQNVACSLSILLFVLLSLAVGDLRYGRYQLYLVADMSCRSWAGCVLPSGVERVALPWLGRCGGWGSGRLVIKLFEALERTRRWSRTCERSSRRHLEQHRHITMQSIRRSCHSALRASNGLATSASASVNGSRRAFSRTAARSKGAHGPCRQQQTALTNS